MRHLIDQQGAYARPCPPQTWRHKAPTGAPARTQVRVGGEGTTFARAVAPRALGSAQGRNTTLALSEAFRMLLDVERAESESVTHMRALARAAFGTASLEPLMTALVSIEYQWRETVERICQRGGLLLISGKA